MGVLRKLRKNFNSNWSDLSLSRNFWWYCAKKWDFWGNEFFSEKWRKLINIYLLWINFNWFNSIKILKRNCWEIFEAIEENFCYFYCFLFFVIFKLKTIKLLWLQQLLKFGFWHYWEFFEGISEIQLFLV